MGKEMKERKRGRIERDSVRDRDRER